MKRLHLFFGLLLITASVQAQKVTEIKGYAPNSLGKALEIYQITDYVTMREERIATTTVQNDSSFSCSFYLDETRKLLVKSNNNVGYLFASPGETYQIVLPDRDPYSAYRPAGNLVQLIFLDMEPTDINYKILSFDRMVDNFVARFYTKTNADSIYFVRRFDKFRAQLDSMYAGDTLDRYFTYHRKFSIARVDNLRFNGNRSKYEKYDFYLKTTPVYYQNEAYMKYVLDYYDNYLKTVSTVTNEKFYMGVLKSSPSAMYNGLGSDYTMQHNFKLREMMMIKFIGDCYYDKEYPQSNLLGALDSLRNKCLFPYNATIAGAMYERLTDLYSGLKAPDFTVSYNNQIYNLKRFEGKHLYLIFVDPKSSSTMNQLNLLVPMYQKYNTEVRFLTVLIGAENKENKELLAKYPWEGVIVAENSELIKKYKVVTKPSYVLLDRIGYVVQAPALGPLPNGNLQTVDQLFFEIKKNTTQEEPK